MKNETSRKENSNQKEEGFPIQALLMIGLLGLAVIGIILKMVGLV